MLFCLLAGEISLDQRKQKKFGLFGSSVVN